MLFFMFAERCFLRKGIVVHTGVQGQPENVYESIQATATDVHYTCGATQARRTECSAPDDGSGKGGRIKSTLEGM